MKKPVAFLDFQGTIGGNGLDDINTLTLFPFAYDAIKKLNDRGVLVVGITNQSHIAKGVLTWQDYEIHRKRIEVDLASHDAYFDAIYCCPHEIKDNCNCIKPKTGMIEQVQKDFDIDKQRMFVVGDMGATDMVLAKNINAKAILVLTGVGKGSLTDFKYLWQDIEPDFVAQNLFDAVEFILNFVKQ